MENLYTCSNCGKKYDWRRSTSISLKMTFCTYTCEKCTNGATIEQILSVIHTPWTEVLREVSGHDNS